MGATPVKDQQDLSRRRFVRGAAATGVAATSLGAFGGQAAGQQQFVDITGGDTVQSGEQLALSLISVQLQNVNVNALNQNNVQVIIDDEVVNVEDVTVVGGDVANIDIQDVNVVAGAAVNVVVAILGAAQGAAGNVQKFKDETTLDITEGGNVS